MRTTIKISILACGVALCASSTSRADDYGDEPDLQTGYGVSTLLGGGVTGFTDQTMRDTTSSVGGLWDLRVTLGSHYPVAIDLGYLGSAAGIDALAGNQSGTLVGTTAEGALRYNAMPHSPWNPYAFAGVGWQRYDTTGGTFTLSDSGMNATDNSVVFPMGAGIQYRSEGMVFDLRGTFRANVSQGLVKESMTSTDYAPMHVWGASGAIGYEF